MKFVSKSSPTGDLGGVHLKVPMTPEQLMITLRTRRHLLKITQTDLAELSGVSLRTIKAIEEGTANPTIETIDRILSVLGLALGVADRVSHE